MTPDRIQEMENLKVNLERSFAAFQNYVVRPYSFVLSGSEARLVLDLLAARATAEAAQNDLTITAAMLEACRKALTAAEAEGRRQGVAAASAYLSRNYGDEMIEATTALDTEHWGPVLLPTAQTEAPRP